jgi:hypothetical protein
MLTLQSAKVRREKPYDSCDENLSYDENPNGNDSRFIYQTGGNVMQSICTSSAQNDSGMFELNFNDERYLPFENAGVISEWQLRFPAGCNTFDMFSVSDVILHINYTALYDESFRKNAENVENVENALKAKLPIAGALLFSPKADFPDAWNAMNDENISNSMCFSIKTANLPFFLRGRGDIQVDCITVALSIKKKEGLTHDAIQFTIEKDNANVITPSSEGNEGSLTVKNPPLENGDMLAFSYYGDSIEDINVLGDGWKLNIDGVTPSEIEDIVLGFTLKKV